MVRSVWCRSTPSWLPPRLAAAAIFAVGISGCGDEGSAAARPVDPENSNAALIRVVHASPNTPAVTLHVADDPSLVVPNTSFGGSSEYVALTPGEFQLDLRTAGEDQQTTEPLLTTDTLVFERGSRHTLLVAGMLGAPSGEDALRVLRYEETFGAPADGQARLRWVHGVPDAPELGLDLTQDGVAEFRIERFSETGASGITVPSDLLLPLDVWDSRQNTRLTSFTVQVPARTEAFVVAAGQLFGHPRNTQVLAPGALATSGETPNAQARSNPGFSLIVAGQQGGAFESGRVVQQDPVLYALHAAADVDAVDVFVDTDGDDNAEVELFDDLTSGELANQQETVTVAGTELALGDPRQLQPGSYLLELFQHVAGSVRPGGQPLLSTRAAFRTGERYLAVLVGANTPTAQREPLSLVVVEDAIDLADSGSQRTRLLHAASGLGPVDVGAVSGGAFVQPLWFQNVAFGSASDPAGTVIAAPMTPGAVRVGVGAAGASPAFGFDVSVAAAVRSLVVVAGSTVATENPLVAVVIGMPPFFGGSMDAALGNRWFWLQAAVN